MKRALCTVATLATLLAAPAAFAAAKKTPAKKAKAPTKMASAKTAETAETAPVSPSGPPAPVYCGSFTPLHFRVTALGKTPETRSLHAMDVINKFLGGKAGKFTTKPDAKSKGVQVLLNNEFLAVVTPQDAAAEKLKSPTELATKWVKALTVAFNASKAQP